MKRKNKILVIHHTDLDGSASAAIVGLKHKNDNVVYRMYNYGGKLPSLSGYDLIYAVDVSFQDHPEVYRTQGLIWIDHHKTAIEGHPELQNIPGLREIGRGACELTWQYLFPAVDCPSIIQYLSTYDVWDKSRLPWSAVEEIEWGAKYYFGISPKPLLEFLKNPAREDLRFLRDAGNLILGYQERLYRGRLQNTGFYLGNFYGYRVLALNTSDFSSMVFTSYYNPQYFDIMMPFQIYPIEGQFGGVEVRVSFYTEDPSIDVSKIAQNFGGGGHCGAAGGRMSIETLQSILKDSISIKDFIKDTGFQGNTPTR